ncbi:tubulin/FtsZ domain containing protein [Klebsormidium nitens]|uniref:Tubulin/FtsZ domain containing protein n=1 Tax=Klebsormidium nitens TaxID=105231 RepID=A0A1Y1IKX8_KLENI|nr:tubulin/FtsZ domain containing protein [Klebsormidium nitens]|eukprot:GAQ89801.1 tubulin/FtsZ domain containing protein [Klebsormidium nitens]
MSPSGKHGISKAVASERCSDMSPTDSTGLTLCEPEEKSVQRGRVLAIGMGTAGGKMVAHIGDCLAQQSRAEFDAVELWAMNTDVQALRDTHAPHHLQLGSELTKGLGTGGDRTVGAQAAEVSAAAIAEVVGGRPGVCFVICGAGGGTGGGASPLVLSAARAAGHLAVAVVTLPFSFEGQRRLRQARASLAALQGAADVVFAIDQDAFLQQRQDLSMTQAARMAADLALHATRGITTCLQAEAASPPAQPASLSRSLLQRGVVQMLRASGRAVVGHAEGATPVRALLAALQAPGLGSLHMVVSPTVSSVVQFASSVVCVLSSAAPLSPAQVRDARASAQALTGGRIPLVVATRQDATAAAVGATVILTGLPHELAEAPAASTAAARPPPPQAPLPPLAARVKAAPVTPGLQASATAQRQKPNRETVTQASLTSSSSKTRGNAATKQAVASETRQKDGARLPPPPGRIRVWSAGGTSVDELSSQPKAQDMHGDKEPLEGQAGVLEPYSSILDGPRNGGYAAPHKRSEESPRPQERDSGQGSRPGADAIHVDREAGRESNGAQAAGQKDERGTAAPREKLLDQLSAAKSNGTPNTPVQGVGPVGAPADARRQTGQNGRAGMSVENESQGGGAQAETRAGAQGATREQDHDRARSFTAASPSRSDATQGPAQAAWTQSRRRPESLSSPAARAQPTERLGAGQGAGSSPADQLDGAAAAHAAALQWWREVVEAHAEDSTDDAGEGPDEDDEGVRADPEEGSAASSVSSRARAILARERDQERYRQVRGRQVLPDGSEYEGHLAAGQPHGHGRCAYPGGDVYEGAWKNGERHGWGRLAEASGDVYEGDWRHGHRHGKGRVEYADGHVLSARFVGGHVHGPAIIAFRQGSTFYGAFAFNRRQGVAVTVDANGKREWEVWEHGQRIS